jgi:hypothetical protein
MLTPEASSRQSSADLYRRKYRVISRFFEKPMIFFGVMFTDVHLNFDSQGFLKFEINPHFCGVLLAIRDLDPAPQTKALTKTTKQALAGFDLSIARKRIHLTVTSRFTQL